MDQKRFRLLLEEVKAASNLQRLEANSFQEYLYPPRIYEDNSAYYKLVEPINIIIDRTQ